MAPGQVATVKVAYRDTIANKWWDPVAKSFSPGLGGSGAPPSNAFVSTSVVGGAWSLSAASTPSWADNGVYQIYAMAVDSAANTSDFPGDSNFTVPPTTSSYIEFTFQTPLAVTQIASPAAGIPHFRTSAPNAITLNGTAQFSTTVQVQILDCTLDNTRSTSLTFPIGTGCAFVSTTGWVNNGFNGANSF